jgi:hypothetical protein
MSDTLILDMPMELGLELMPIIGPDLLDAEREPFDNVIDEVDRVGLSVFVVDLERSDVGSAWGSAPGTAVACAIVDGSMLGPADFLAALTDESEELNVHLDVMAWKLLVVALGMDFAVARSAR